MAACVLPLPCTMTPKNCMVCVGANCLPPSSATFTSPAFLDNISRKLVLNRFPYSAALPAKARHRDCNFVGSSAMTETSPALQRIGHNSMTGDHSNARQPAHESARRFGGHLFPSTGGMSVLQRVNNTDQQVPLARTRWLMPGSRVPTLPIPLNAPRAGRKPYRRRSWR